jgi:predicted nuclease with TOPRIM domain
MEQLKEKLSSLEIENAMLASQLKELADTSRQLQENYQAWIQAASAQELAEPVEAIPTGTVEEAKTLPLVIPSAGPGRAVRLRVPMSP